MVLGESRCPRNAVRRSDAKALCAISSEYSHAFVNVVRRHLVRPLEDQLVEAEKEKKANYDHGEYLEMLFTQFWPAVKGIVEVCNELIQTEKIDFANETTLLKIDRFVALVKKVNNRRCRKYLKRFAGLFEKGCEQGPKRLDACWYPRADGRFCVDAQHD